MASRTDLLPRDFHVPSMKGDFFKAKIYRILGFLFIYDRYLFLGFLTCSLFATRRKERDQTFQLLYFLVILLEVSCGYKQLKA